jgi:hypothetical protein
MTFRPLVRVAVLTLTLGPVAFGHVGVLAGLLAASFAAHGHGHVLSLLADGGHVDVVLHPDGEPARAGEVPLGLGAHEGDHVVHAAAASDGVRDSSRRTSPLLVLTAPGPPLPVCGAASELAKPAPPASLAAASLLRTTILRI